MKVEITMLGLVGGKPFAKLTIELPQPLNVGMRFVISKEARSWSSVTESDLVLNPGDPGGACNVVRAYGDQYEALYDPWRISGEDCDDRSGMDRSTYPEISREGRDSHG